MLAWFPADMVARAGQGLDVDYTRQIGQSIRDRSGPDDYVLAMDSEAGFQILAWSDRPSSGRWFNPFFVNVPGVRESMHHDVLDHPPRFIVAPRYWGFDPKTGCHGNGAWPPCLQPLRPACRPIFSHLSNGPAYEVYEYCPAVTKPTTDNHE